VSPGTVVSSSTIAPVAETVIDAYRVLVGGVQVDHRAAQQLAEPIVLPEPQRVAESAAHEGQHGVDAVWVPGPSAVEGTATDAPEIRCTGPIGGAIMELR